MKEININIEGYNVNGICVGCLNYNRQMFYREEVKECFKLLGDIDVPDGLSIQVCWECLAAVQNVSRFQTQILRSYEILINYSRKHTFLNSPSDFTKHATTRLSIYHSDSDLIPVIPKVDEDSKDDVKVKTEDSELYGVEVGHENHDQSNKIMSRASKTSDGSENISSKPNYYLLSPPNTNIVNSCMDINENEKVETFPPYNDIEADPLCIIENVRTGFQTEAHKNRRLKRAQDSKRTNTKVSNTANGNGYRKTMKRLRTKDYCLYCEGDVSNFARHVIRNHSLESEVQKVLSCPKKSSARKNILTQLRKKGNYIKKVGECTKPMKRSSIHTDNYYMPCENCLGYYAKKQMWKHKKNCEALSEISSTNAIKVTDDIPVGTPKVKSPDDSNTTESSTKKKRKLIPLTPQRKNCSPLSETSKTKKINITDDISVETPKVTQVSDEFNTTGSSTKKTRNLIPWTSQRKNCQPLSETSNTNKINVTDDIPVETPKVTQVSDDYNITESSSKKTKNCHPWSETSNTKKINVTDDISVETPKVTQVSDSLNTTEFGTKKKRNLVPWTSQQKIFATKFFSKHIKSKRPPKRHECENLRSLHPEVFHNKDWLKIKVFIQNVYTQRFK